MSIKRVFSLAAALVLASCCVMACDDDGGSDESSGAVTKTLNDGNNEPRTCEVLQTTTDYSLSSQSDIVNYLIKHCKLSTYFRDNSKFLQSDQKFGSPCFCYGHDCSMAGYERPEVDKIIGCDNIGAAEYESIGVVPICLRSSRIEHVKPEIYFPNGLCTLAVSNCTAVNDPKGNGYICSFANFGKYDENFDKVKYEESVKKFIEKGCPDGHVLGHFDMGIEISIDATNPTTSRLDIYACMPGCKQDSDCRAASEYDFIVQEQSQTKCMETDTGEGVTTKAKICFDDRIKRDSSIGILAVNPGNYAIE